METIKYKGQFGTVYEQAEEICETVKNQFSKEEYNVCTPSIIIMVVASQDKPVVGDHVMTTSGEFMVDALRGCYQNMNHDYYESKIVARFLEFEGDNYTPGKATNGGGYLHTWWKIEEIVSSKYVE